MFADAGGAFILRTNSSALLIASFGRPAGSSGTVPDMLAKDDDAFPLTTPGVVISDMDESLKSFT